ncbi:anti-repressor SinI family protein [Alicyclobacillus dauci]|uniref:Anti-repressor SinI family protein n=1 Tax=Alicyclobacillus dauci TaxID=1475485 RepID=A0ABY6Z365_9BACL|nr:anti-repressor SinI family protein [Alicyclobacillus dauci]WAH36771.1 anti-repressor SinI family protein [Alicyclobacillus dauci]
MKDWNTMDSASYVEWAELLQLAREVGISPEEIRKFLAQSATSQPVEKLGSKVNGHGSLFHV